MATKAGLAGDSKTSDLDLPNSPSPSPKQGSPSGRDPGASSFPDLVGLDAKSNVLMWRGDEEGVEGVILEAGTPIGMPMEGQDRTQSKEKNLKRGGGRGFPLA